MKQYLQHLSPSLSRELAGYPDLRVEDLGYGLKIFSLKGSFTYGEEQYCFGHWLAENLPLRLQEFSFLDAGSGTGVLSFLLRALRSQAQGLAVELMPRPYLVLQANIELNQLSNLDAWQMDLHYLARTAAKPLKTPAEQSFDLLVANPPFFELGTGPKRAQTSLSEQEQVAAREEQWISLADYFLLAKRFLKPGAYLALLHRPERLGELFILAKEHGFSPWRLRAVQAQVGKAPQAVFFLAVKRPGTRLSWQAPLIMREADFSYTAEVKAYYEEEADVK